MAKRKAESKAGGKPSATVTVTDPKTGKSVTADLETMTKALEAKDGAAPGTSGNVSGGQLKSIVERIERLEEEKAALGADIRDIYTEAKANGFDPKVLRQVVKIRAMDQNERQEIESLLDLYLHALGMA